MDNEAKTPLSKRVPFRIKLGWGAGGLADNYIMNAFLQLVNPIYNLGLGLDPKLIGQATGIPRFFDALFDVWLGNVSDNTRSKWGRRRPYIFAGAILSAVLLPLLWMPPVHTQNGMFWFLAIMSTIYLLAYSLYVVPYNALGFELTQDYDERTRVQSWRAFIGLLGSLTIPWIYKLTLATGHTFRNTEVFGAQVVSVGLGIIILATGLLPVIFCRENLQVQGQGKISMLSAIRSTLANRSFGILSTAYVIIIAGLFTSGVLGLYVTLFTICGGNKDFCGSIIGWAGTATTAGAYISVPLAVWVATHFGKREAMMGGLLLIMTSAILQWFTLSSRWAGVPSYLQPQIFAGFIFGLGVQGCWVMMDAMTVDVCDEDELKTGLRREGMYGAVRSLTLKAAIAFANITGAYVLVGAGYVTNVNPSPVVVSNMKICYVGIQSAGFIIAMILFMLYPITRARARETRGILEARKPRPS